MSKKPDASNSKLKDEFNALVQTCKEETTNTSDFFRCLENLCNESIPFKYECLDFLSNYKALYNSAEAKRYCKYCKGELTLPEEQDCHAECALEMEQTTSQETAMMRLEAFFDSDWNDLRNVFENNALRELWEYLIDNDPLYLGHLKDIWQQDRISPAVMLAITAYTNDLLDRENAHEPLNIVITPFTNPSFNDRGNIYGKFISYHIDRDIFWIRVFEDENSFNLFLEDYFFREMYNTNSSKYQTQDEKDRLLQKVIENLGDIESLDMLQNQSEFSGYIEDNLYFKEALTFLEPIVINYMTIEYMGRRAFE